jgi:hypothetical protein
MDNRSLVLVCGRFYDFMTYIIKQIVYCRFFENEVVYTGGGSQAPFTNSLRNLSLFAISTIERDRGRVKYSNDFNNNYKNRILCRFFTTKYRE